MAGVTDGGPPRRRRVKAEPAPTTSDPVEIAMEAEASGDPPRGVAHEVLVEHRQLIRWQVANERAGFALKLVIGVAGLAVTLAMGLMVWDASRASGAVIEPFDTAPGLAASGLTGEAVANELLSRVTAMQQAAGANRPFRQSSNGADRINVVIPQTGVSIGEAQRLLRGWLGHETYVSGALRPGEGGGLELSLRVDGVRVVVPAPPDPRRGSPDAWLDAGAEATFRETDPYRYATWLVQRGRDTESEAVFRRLTRSGSVVDRAWGWTGLSSAMRRRGDFAGSVAAVRNALAMDPTLATARQILYEQHGQSGQDEHARYWAREAARSAESLDRNSRTSNSTRAKAWDNDWLGVVEQTDRRVSQARTWGSQDYPPSTISNWGRAYARLHQPVQASLILHDDDPLRNWTSLSAAATLLAETERWRELEQILARPWNSFTTTPVQVLADRTMRWPWQAYVAARLGRLDEARALIARTPADCYLCVRMRGRIAALAGQPSEADRWFAEAVRQGPSLADADLEWAQVKLQRGDSSGARALAQQAARKAPRWADPLKLQGDLYLQAGDAKAAGRAYATASRLAPRWATLHLRWGEALAKLGKADDARAKWRAAATMDLTAAERAELAQVSR